MVTRSGEAPALESECEQLGCEVRVVRIATLPAEEAGSYGRYLRWLWHTSLFVRREAANFDVLHHATFASDWLPPPVLFGGAGGVRLVWGPAGGNTYPPMRLAKRIGMRYLASTVVRTCSTKAVRSLTHIFMSGRVDTFIAMTPTADVAHRGHATSSSNPIVFWATTESRSKRYPDRNEDSCS